MNMQKDWIVWLGRSLLAAMFFISGFGKLTGFDGTAGDIASKGLPLPQLQAVIAILIELGGGIAVILGWKTRLAALAFIVFLIVITPIFAGCAARSRLIRVRRCRAKGSPVHR